MGDGRWHLGNCELRALSSFVFGNCGGGASLCFADGLTRLTTVYLVLCTRLLWYNGRLGIGMGERKDRNFVFVAGRFEIFFFLVCRYAGTRMGLKKSEVSASKIDANMYDAISAWTSDL